MGETQRFIVVLADGTRHEVTAARRETATGYRWYVAVDGEERPGRHFDAEYALATALGELVPHHVELLPASEPPRAALLPVVEAARRYAAALAAADQAFDAYEARKTPGLGVAQRAVIEARIALLVAVARLDASTKDGG